MDLRERGGEPAARPESAALSETRRQVSTPPRSNGGNKKREIAAFFGLRF